MKLRSLSVLAVEGMSNTACAGHAAAQNRGNIAVTRTPVEREKERGSGFDLSRNPRRTD